MTDTEIIERLAIEVVGRTDFPQDKPGIYDRWNPLTDWNHWRQVEEKVMENQTLWLEFRRQYNLWSKQDDFRADNYDHHWKVYMKADLPTRCRALLSALDSISSQPSKS
jgi:hypothetical protein